MNKPNHRQHSHSTTLRFLDLDQAKTAVTASLRSTGPRRSYEHAIAEFIYSVDVKLFEQDGELYVLAKSEGRRAKETAMRLKRLARLLRKLRAMRRSLLPSCSY